MKSEPWERKSLYSHPLINVVLFSPTGVRREEDKWGSLMLELKYPSEVFKEEMGFVGHFPFTLEFNFTPTEAFRGITFFLFDDKWNRVRSAAENFIQSVFEEWKGRVSSELEGEGMLPYVQGYELVVETIPILQGEISFSFVVKINFRPPTPTDVSFLKSEYQEKLPSIVRETLRRVVDEKVSDFEAMVSDALGKPVRCADYSFVGITHSKPEQSYRFWFRASPYVGYQSLVVVSRRLTPDEVTHVEELFKRPIPFRSVVFLLVNFLDIYFTDRDVRYLKEWFDELCKYRIFP